MSIETEQPVSLAGLRRRFGDEYMINAVNAHHAAQERIARLTEALALVVSSGPLNNGMRDDATMQIARETLEGCK